jgi:hypothetical protein
MTLMTDTTPHVRHRDTRVQVILTLAQLAADEQHAFDTLAEAVAVVVRNVEPWQADVRAVFRGIMQDLETAVDFDTRGAEAVIDVYGQWSSTDYRAADERASELRDEHRASARTSAEWLVTLDDRS